MSDNTLLLQRRLNELGLSRQALGTPLAEDGIYGPLTDSVHRAYLDQDPMIPTVTPPPVIPWWQSRPFLGAVATIAASVAGLAGWAIDAGQLSEVLVSLATAAAGVLALIGTLHQDAPVDPRLAPRRVSLSAQSGADHTTEHGPFGY